MGLVDREEIEERDDEVREERGNEGSIDGRRREIDGGGQRDFGFLGERAGKRGEQHPAPVFIM